MRVSQVFVPTLRESPAEAEIVSHKLMLRAGMIRKAASGVYTYLPLGYRVIKKIEHIIREEMDRAGGQELLLPIIQPAELWQETGRWDVYGEEMFRLRDRHQRQFCLGPTHEEIITALVRAEVSSYKQLPLMLYQIQNKYRDEIRPRFGLMRGREFIMKDLYSFDRDEEGMKVSYQKMYQAYTNVFRRCGLKFRAVEADTGAIGGTVSHEFMVLAESGEAIVAYCSRCDYAANLERAECLPVPGSEEEHESISLVPTPGCRTIDEVSSYLKVPPERIIKSLLCRVDGEVIVVLVRGDHGLNEVKLRNALGAMSVEWLSPEEVERLLGVEAGFIGPVGARFPVYADISVQGMHNAVVGANRSGYHLTGVSAGRDFDVHRYLDLRLAASGDCCPRCKQGTLELVRGIEVGQIFQLGTKYSEPLGAVYTDEKGQERFIVMGCYGIGVGRTAAAAVEQCHDADGIIWPASIAPYHVVVVPVNVNDPGQLGIAEQIYQDLLRLNMEVLLDDRQERAGVKFVDADLVGYPVRVTVGRKSLEQGTVDIKLRSTGEEVTVYASEAPRKVAGIVDDLLQGLK